MFSRHLFRFTLILTTLCTLSGAARRASAAPENDNFAHAYTITGTTGSMPGTGAHPP